MNLSPKIEPFDYTPTLNGMGYMSSSLDDIQRSFVQFCEKKPSGLFLDIGCGFGVATIPLVQKCCHVIACDLEEAHLSILKAQVPEQKRQYLTLIKGDFVHQVQFPKDRFDAINISMVLHFLSPHAIEWALAKIFLSLKKGGQLFLTTSSPYQKALASFIPLYESKVGCEEWPGYIEDIAQYVPHRAHLLPKKNIVFCPTELERILSKFGFHVLRATFFSREDLPGDLKFDGREYAGVVCEKSSSSSFFCLEKYKAPNPIAAANKR